MTVGDMIALLCKHASETDVYLMAKSIFSIDIDEEKIRLYFTDANTENYEITARIEEDDEEDDAEGKWENGVYVTKPKRYGDFPDSEHNYAYCNCPVSLDYALILPKRKKGMSCIPYRCQECGTEGTLYFGGGMNELRN